MNLVCERYSFTVASLCLLSKGGRLHSCSAVTLLVEETAPIMILETLSWTESSFCLAEVEAGVQIGEAYSSTGLITVLYMLLRVWDLEPQEVPHNFLRIFNFFRALFTVFSMYFVKRSSGSKMIPRYLGW
ncbi:hypothetical protein NPIL_520181 [Nephila pilipes]|uniref:Uncharacterized protein n=1 Tax=Nephila pilipes TaxID=299642 RepID=A0A8X6TXA8_NEPPI|nr:hypothetical protein NPIL_520181 [Nephila pilipes]